MNPADRLSRSSSSKIRKQRNRTLPRSLSLGLSIKLPWSRNTPSRWCQETGVSMESRAIISALPRHTTAPKKRSRWLLTELHESLKKYLGNSSFRWIPDWFLWGTSHGLQLGWGYLKVFVAFFRGVLCHEWYKLHTNIYFQFQLMLLNGWTGLHEGILQKV